MTGVDSFLSLHVDGYGLGDLLMVSGFLCYCLQCI